MSRRSLQPNPDPTVWVPWFRSGAKVGTTASYGLLQVFLQVRIHDGDVDFTAHGASAGGCRVPPASSVRTSTQCVVRWVYRPDGVRVGVCVGVGGGGGASV
jgi:hypothetical protein